MPNTKIIDINKDQKIISHESGFVSLFKISSGCAGCAYKNTKVCNIDAIPCYCEDRNDGLNGIFIPFKL